MTLDTAQTTASKTEARLHSKDLAPYMPPRAELSEFASRLKKSLSYRGADKLEDHELLALAAASHAHNLNPYLGEIWAIPGKGLMIGRAGWVKKLNEQLEPRGIRWWPQYLEIRNAEEREKYGVPATAKLAYVCELRRSDQIEAYMDVFERMTKISGQLGMNYDQIIEMIGKPPVIRGVGYIEADKAQEGYMSLGERCKKRAFAQACKEIVSLPFEVVTEGDAGDGFIYDGDFDELPPEPTPDPKPESTKDDDKPAEPPKVETPKVEPAKPASEPQKAAAEKRPRSAEVVRELIRERIASQPTGGTIAASQKQRTYIATMLGKAFEESATTDKDRHAVTEWLIGKPSLKDLTTAEASTLIAWLKDETGELSFDGEKEANAVLIAALKDQGQMDMFDEKSEEKAAAK